MKISVKKTLPPETFLYTGEIETPTTVRHIKYNLEEYLVYDKLSPLSDNYVDWVIIEGLSDVNRIKKICLEYDVDALVIEDILNVQQRNKVELHEKFVFTVQKYKYIYDNEIRQDYVSMLLFDDLLISFSESNNLFVDNIYSRIKNKNSLIRAHSHRYLFYVMFDLIVDESIHVSSFISDQVNKYEDKLLSLTRHDELVLYNLRKELSYLRNHSLQIVDNIFRNQKILNRIQTDQIQKYYNDLYDHALSIIDRSKYELEIITSIFDIYLNNMSQKMNSIMTTLTIFSAVFIPLSFIAGVFGMNFTNFPILSNPQGMLIFIFICISLPFSMLGYFKYKKWF